MILLHTEQGIHKSPSNVVLTSETVLTSELEVVAE